MRARGICTVTDLRVSLASLTAAPRPGSISLPSGLGHAIPGIVPTVHCSEPSCGLAPPSLGLTPSDQIPNAVVAEEPSGPDR